MQRCISGTSNGKVAGTALFAINSINKNILTYKEFGVLENSNHKTNPISREYEYRLEDNEVKVYFSEKGNNANDLFYKIIFDKNSLNKNYLDQRQLKDYSPPF